MKQELFDQFNDDQKSLLAEAVADPEKFYHELGLDGVARLIQLDVCLRALTVQRAAWRMLLTLVPEGSEAAAFASEIDVLLARFADRAPSACYDVAEKVTDDPGGMSIADYEAAKELLVFEGRMEGDDE